MTPSIVVVGSCMIDFVSYAPRLPIAGETIHGTKFVNNFGGKGANQCVAAAKLGGNVTMIGRVGDDIWGVKYIDYLNGLNVNSEYVRTTTDCSTGVAQIIVSESGENQIVITAGANQKLDVTDVKLAEHIIRHADVLVLQLETPPEVAIEALEMCTGISILNGAPAIAKFDSRLLNLPTIFCVNESEASIFSGHLVRNESEAKRAALELFHKGCNSVIITLGDDGAMYVNKSEKVIHVPAPVVNPVDTTGAGDAFIGALAYLLAYKKDMKIETCVGLACAAAADSVTKPGTQASFPGPEVFGMD